MIASSEEEKQKNFKRRMQCLAYSVATHADENFTLLPQKVNFCETCGKMLDHVQCPKNRRIVHACSINGDNLTCDAYCTCENYNITERIAEDLFNAVMRTNMQPFIVQPNKSEPKREMCESYYQISYRFFKFYWLSIQFTTYCNNLW